MNNAGLSIIIAFFISLLSFIGSFTFILNEKLLHKILTLLIGFAAGSLIGGAFIHLLPEAISHYRSVDNLFLLFLVGFVCFFLMERFMYWRHCHESECNVHPFGYLNLIGGAIHNITDGLIIASAFYINKETGIATSIAIASHKIPHELGDIAVLLSSKFSKKKALIYNYISDLFIIIGALIGIFLITKIENMSIILSAASAGGFVYVAASDLIPMIHQNKNQNDSNKAFVFFVLGLIFMWFSKKMFQ